MTFSMGEKAGISRQRGLWLRCFLGPALGVLFLGWAGAGALHAQVELDKPVHLAHVQGLVVNSLGKPVPHAEIVLEQDGKPIYTTRTSNAGAFRFDHVQGRYTFRVERTQYAPAAKDIIVDFQIASQLERKKLYVIVGPGACADECSSVFTSKREFQKAMKKRKGSE
jgi:hypothetical protein